MPALSSSIPEPAPLRVLPFHGDAFDWRRFETFCLDVVRALPDVRHAEVYGVPVACIPSDRKVPAPPPTRPAMLVQALEDRWDLRIEFPKVDGYRVEVPDEQVAPLIEAG